MAKNEMIDQIKKIVRRIDSLQKTVDLLFEDRSILEDIQGRLTAVEEQLKLNRQHDNQVRKDIKEEIQTVGQNVQGAVEDKIDEINNQIEKKKIITIKNPKRWFLFWKR